MGKNILNKNVIPVIKGDKGDAGTIQVGEVVTLPPGSSATITNRGTASAAILDFGIPITNNVSERALRGVKTKMKVSGQFQNLSSAEYYANIRSYIETCHRNGINELEALQRLASGNPFTLSEILNNQKN